jgi:hypothetical protein
VKLLTPTDFPAGDDTHLWLRVPPERVRWFDPASERALDDAGAAVSSGRARFPRPSTSDCG